MNEKGSLLYIRIIYNILYNITIDYGTIGMLNYIDSIIDRICADTTRLR